MAQIHWSDIADKHHLTPAERKSFFLSANTLACALSGNITLVIAKGADSLLSLPVGHSLDKEKRMIEFREIYQTADQRVRAALDDYIDECKKWLKIK